MNRSALSFICFMTVMTSWSQQSFAARQVASGPLPIPLSAEGMLEGVDMQNNAGTGTLIVGTVGGPQTDIFSNNNPVGTVPGLAVSTDASSLSNITFNSSSTVFGDIGTPTSFFLDIAAGLNDTTVNFLGSVNATRLNLTQTGTVNFNSGSINTTAMNLAGDGTISLAPNTTVIGALTTAAANTGTLELGGFSVLDGAVGGATGLRAINVVGGSNLAGVSSTITGAVDAYSFSLGTNTLNIGGGLTIANEGPGGVINTTLASPTVYGNIRPVGTTLLGPTLTVNATVPSSAYIPVGTQFNIIQAASGTDGSVVTVTVQDPTNPLYTFSAVPLAGTVAGQVTIETTGIPLQSAANPPSGGTQAAVSPLAAGIVPTLLAATVTPDLARVLAAINAFSDQDSVINAVAQLAPSTSGSVAPLVAFQGVREFQNLWMSRLNICSNVNLYDNENSPCRENDPQSGWWLQGSGYFSEQDADAAYGGYEANTLGTMLGYDVPLGTHTRAGLGAGYARSSIDGKTFDNSTDVDTYQATAYLGHERGLWFVNGSVSIGWNEYSGKRHILFTGVDRTADADYDGQNYTAFVNTGYHFPLQKFTITPLASLQYTYMNLDDYTETGAGDINLKVDSQDYNFLESGLGVKVERSFSYSNKMTLVPDVHLKWFHELSNPSLENTASFNSVGTTPFTTPELKSPENTYNVGAGLTLLSCACDETRWSVEAVYDHEWGSDSYSADRVMAMLSVNF